MNGEHTIELSRIIHEDKETHVPSEKEQKVLTDVVDLFRRTADARNKNYEYFDGLNLIDYIDDSVRRFNTNIDEREDMEDWQAGIHDPFTRNKVLAVLGKVMQVLPIANFVGRGTEDSRKGQILTELYEYVEELDDYEEFMTHALLESIVKGTSIGFEDIEYTEHKYRDVEGVGDDLKVTEKNEKTTRLYGALVPLEEFYPSSVRVRKIKDMPYAFWRQVMPLATFRETWNQYAKYDLVEGRQTYLEDEVRPYYDQYIGDDVPEGSVELIRYYDKANDQYVVIANGVWLNPIDIKDGEDGGIMEEISPLPWNHKNLPFWEIKFDFFGNFFYGKSLPDRLKSMQDVLNVLTNMLLDQSFLSIFPPLLTNGYDSIEDDYLRPGRRTPVDTQGLPINQAFQIMEQPTPSGWHQFILQYTRKVMEEASLDRVSSGHAGVGDRTTAAEIRTAADGVSSILQLFARMVNYGIKRKALLKASNIMQFGMNTEAPILRQVMGEGAGAKTNKAFQVFELDNAVLSGGKRGTKVLEIYANKEDMPDREEVLARAAVAKADSGKEVEIVAFPPSYIRNMQFDIKVVPNPKNETSKELEKALQLEKVRVYMSFFPQLVNVQELAAETAEKMGDDPSKVLKPDAFQPPTEGGSEQDNGVSTEPTENNANNLARSARGGEEGTAEMAALQAQMTG